MQQATRALLPQSKVHNGLRLVLLPFSDAQGQHTQLLQWPKPFAESVRPIDTGCCSKRKSICGLPLLTFCQTNKTHVCILQKASTKCKVHDDNQSITHQFPLRGYSKAFISSTFFLSNQPIPNFQNYHIFLNQHFPIFLVLFDATEKNRNRFVSG